ncbi:G1/S-specific cyclin-D1-like [Ctenocephalides felis]|uniref:G1/S-specific cyclin-D1-like n=1 Tax=Ctenocephalides felis TaxID=7515 RepID=UPI000E6E492D|nr:G1/S-specific cyclin-D1-like [Ctenocephalides felis]XP_026475934.1 G1/S-specific cyclin-D1-like [Ctenocephalides felis]
MNVNLLCPEAPFGERVDCNFAEVDENLTKDARVMDNMLMLEGSTIPRMNYFANFQGDLLPFMRKVVTTWMLEVCEEQHCEEQVFPLAVNFMDRFLCVCDIPRQQLQLVGATALLVSTKIRQCHNLTIHLLCAYTDHSVAPEEIRTMEVLILTKLNWNSNTITGFDFVDHLIERMPWGHESRLTKRHAHTLVSVCCTEPEFMQTAPSLLATACVCAAVRGLNLPSSQCALADLCAVSRADITLAELMVCHIERVIANETASLQTPSGTPPASNPNSPYQSPEASVSLNII